MKSKAAYVVFGEAKFLDHEDKFGAKELDKFKQGPEMSMPDLKNNFNIEADIKDDNDGAELVFSEDIVKDVMEGTGKSREECIKGLRKYKGDLIDTITNLS
jgi:NACalpha-BTF3-like transcription factor